MSNNENNWWMYHGDAAHTGYVNNSSINSSNVGQLEALHTLTVGGAILSVPAVADGYVYVGTANGTMSGGVSKANGGSFHKIDLASGETVASFYWETRSGEGDTHGFMGMGCTPAVVGDKVFFSAFDGKFYCLSSDSLQLQWCTDMRLEDLDHNQPITNNFGVEKGLPQAEGWSSPVYANGKVYVGIGEGENPHLYAFIFCLNADSGDVEWIYCTNKFKSDVHNKPNVLPAKAVKNVTKLPEQYSTEEDVVTHGCAVWSCIAYDEELNRIYCATGNPAPEADDKEALPALGYAYGILSLDADTGEFKAFTQIPKESNYRSTDIDIDFGGSPIIFERNGRKVVATGCKNGGLFIMDADTLELLNWRQLLPYQKDDQGNLMQIPTVDPHFPDDPNNPNPVVTNEQSNRNYAENLYGTYSTPAIHPDTQSIFIGIGGNNYHYTAPGIDYQTTPFMRAMDWGTLDDIWEMDNGNPQKYIAPSPPMYTTPGESGLSSPAVVNDVVFCSTSKVSLYAFDVKSGKTLWSDDLGMQTGGFNGGYGYCLGPAVCGDYVVAGGLIKGRDGGVLKIYSVKEGA